VNGVNDDLELPPFRAHPLLRDARTMTVFGSLARRGQATFRLRAERRIVTVDAGTRVRVELDRPEGARPRSALLILHGLAGSSESVYVVGTARKACARGLLAARLNARGCGGTEHLTNATYNGGETADIEATARHLVEEEGVERVHLAGFSIGGNMILRAVQRWSAATPPWLRSAAVVSPCLDFGAAVDQLHDGLYRRVIQRRFLRALKEIVLRRHALDPGSVSIEGLHEIRTIRAFDDRYTAPLSGYDGVEDYYARASMVGELDGLRLPTLVVSSRDDRLVPVAGLEGANRPPAGSPVRLCLTESGGHVAFVGRERARTGDWTDLDRRWAENRMVQFAVAHDRG
jgi:predicted alpha/beta-fold hydrolase